MQGSNRKPAGCDPGELSARQAACAPADCVLPASVSLEPDSLVSHRTSMIVRAETTVQEASQSLFFWYTCRSGCLQASAMLKLAAAVDHRRRSVDSAKSRENLLHAAIQGLSSGREATHKLPEVGLSQLS